MSENLKAGNGMKEQAMKRPAAAVHADADATTPMPKKNKKKDDKEKDDQDDDETPEKTDEKASGSAPKEQKQPKK